MARISSWAIGQASEDRTADGRLPGVRIATDWQKKTPLRLLWKTARFGSGVARRSRRWEPACSPRNSAAPRKVVVCYDAGTLCPGLGSRGSEVLLRGRGTVSVPGPRPSSTAATPHAQGAAGKLNCLDAATGRVLSGRATSGSSSEAKLPMWGFSVSPLGFVQGDRDDLCSAARTTKCPWLQRRNRRAGLVRSVGRYSPTARRNGCAGRSRAAA